MPKGFWFWAIWLVWLFFGGRFTWWWRDGRYYVGPYFFLGLVLIGFLGWAVFGAPWANLVR